MSAANETIENNERDSNDTATKLIRVGSRKSEVRKSSYDAFVCDALSE